MGGAASVEGKEADFAVDAANGPEEIPDYPSTYDKFSGPQLMFLTHREKPSARKKTEDMTKEELVACLNEYRAIRDNKWPNQSQPDYYYDLVMCNDTKAWLDKARAKMGEGVHTPLSIQMCTPEVWEKYKDKVSTGGGNWTLSRAINSGLRFPRSHCGCHAGDETSYDDFREFYDPVIEAYHKGFNASTGQMEGMPIPTGSAAERMDPAKIAVKLSDKAKAKVLSTRVRIARNLTGFPLNTGGTVESRKAICDLMEKVYAGFQAEELKGQLFRHSTMSDVQRQALIDGHQMFRGCDRRQSCSGYHVGWPVGRGVFHNPDKSAVNWLNEGDHIRIVSMEKGPDVERVFGRLSKLAGEIEAGLKKLGPVATDEAHKGKEPFMMHPRFGAITCCPSNLGTGCRASVFVMIPTLLDVVGFGGIDKEVRKRKCQIRGSSGEFSKSKMGEVDLSNYFRIGLPEYKLIEHMINCVNWISDCEDACKAAKEAGKEWAFPAADAK